MRDGADGGPRSTGPRITHVWNVLDRDRRLAAIAAVLLFATMFLPWYQQNVVVSAAKTDQLKSPNLSAFAVFSFIEAAVLLVAVAVLFLLYERAEGRAFHLPGSDGAVVFAAGIWTALLLVLRLFDKPGITRHGVAANVGVQWGIFFALAAAGLLTYAGSRMRAGRQPQPPLIRDAPRAPRERPHRPSMPPEEDPTVIAPRSPRGATSAAPSATRERPGDAAPPVAVAREHSAAAASSSDAEPSPAPERARYPPAPPAKPRQRAASTASDDQLSFEDSPPAG